MNASPIDDDDDRSYVIRLRERAKRDIDAALVRLAEVASGAVAKTWRGELEDAIAGLAYSPRRYPIAPERFDLEVRQLIYRRVGSRLAYRVIFTIVNEQSDSLDPPTVFILHVRHAASRPISRKEAREIDRGD